MTKDAVINEYFDWMYNLMCGRKRLSYRKLFSALHNITFQYTMEMDGNRAADGEDLRYRFGSDSDMREALIATYLDDRPCTVLEMLVGLAIRCEEHIMGDDDAGDRTSEWFWTMLHNLGLAYMDDTKFDLDYVEQRVDIFMRRKYNKDGKNGGLFIVKNPDRDLRYVEIWYQLMWYLNEVLGQ